MQLLCGHATTLAISRILGAIIVLGAVGAPSAVYAARLWAIGEDATLYEIDTDAMTMTQPNPPAAISGLFAVATIDPGAIYLYTTQRELYVYQRGVGHTLIGVLEEQTSPTALGSGRDGFLYLGDPVSFVRIEPIAMETELVRTGHLRYTGDLAADLAGTLFGSANGQLMHVDKTNGSLTPVGPLSITAYGLAFARDGRLFAAGAPGPHLYEIDPMTGEASAPLFSLGIVVYDLASDISCGDGVIDASEGETCDDANGVGGDGCTHSCQTDECHECSGEPSICAPLADGSPCDDGTFCSENDACTGLECAGTPTDGSPCDDGTLCTQNDTCMALECAGTPSPQTDCRNTTGPGKAQLLLAKKIPTKAHKLKWRWRGEDTDLLAIGDPATSTDYEICLFDVSTASQPLVSLTAPAGGSCKGGLPCWTPVGNPPASKGHKYSDALVTPDGIKTIRLKPGADGKAAVGVKGKGPLLTLPSLPLTPPVTVQLMTSNGECWTATYSTSTNNEVTKYKATSD